MANNKFKNQSKTSQFKFKELVFMMLLLIFSSNVVLSQETTRSSASFDFNEKGIIFQTSDTSSQVMMRFRIQSSMTFNTESEEDFSIANSDMSIRRMRLRFGGFLHDPRLTFNLQLSFARGDMDFKDSDIPNIIRDAMVFWNIRPNLQIGVGQTKLPGNRQRVISSGDLQFPERSLVNSKFTLDRDFGVQAYYSHSISDVLINLRGAISTGDGRYAPQMSGAKFAYTGRVELLPFGRFAQGGDYFESDLSREPKPKVSIGLSYSDNKKSTRTHGQLGSKLYSPRDMQSIMSDVLLKYRGFALYGEYAQRNAEDPITRNETGDIKYVYTGTGYLGQMSYLFKNNVEIASRYVVVAPDEELKGLSGADWNRHIAAVCTYYFSKHRAKLQFEITHNTLENKMTNFERKNWMGRFNLELGI